MSMLFSAFRCYEFRLTSIFAKIERFRMIQIIISQLFKLVTNED